MVVNRPTKAIVQRIIHDGQTWDSGYLIDCQPSSETRGIPEFHSVSQEPLSASKTEVGASNIPRALYLSPRDHR
jgi:hypothetical protein